MEMQPGLQEQTAWPFVLVQLVVETSQGKGSTSHRSAPVSDDDNTHVRKITFVLTCVQLVITFVRSIVQPTREAAYSSADGLIDRLLSDTGVLKDVVHSCQHTSTSEELREKI